MPLLLSMSSIFSVPVELSLSIDDINFDLEASYSMGSEYFTLNPNIPVKVPLYVLEASVYH